MRFETIVNVVLTMLAMAFLTALGAWFAVAMRRADLFMPLTWSAAVLATPTILMLVVQMMRVSIARMGLGGTALTAITIAVATMAMGAYVVLCTVPVVLALLLPAGFSNFKAPRPIS